MSATLDDLVARITALRDRSDAARVVVGLVGAPGSGKTTLADSLVARLAGGRDWRGSEVAHVPMDGFHLADAELRRLGRAECKGAPDTFDAEGYAALLARVRTGATVWAPSFERDLEQPIAQSLPVGPGTRVVITEGNYLLLPAGGWPAARAQCDEVWFCRGDEVVRLERLVARHVRFGKTPAAARAWVEAVDQPNADLVAVTIGSADLVVDV